jgi:hypothetical protein
MGGGNCSYGNVTESYSTFSGRQHRCQEIQTLVADLWVKWSLPASDANKLLALKGRPARHAHMHLPVQAAHPRLRTHTIGCFIRASALLPARHSPARQSSIATHAFCSKALLLRHLAPLPCRQHQHMGGPGIWGLLRHLQCRQGGGLGGRQLQRGPAVHLPDKHVLQLPAAAALLAPATLAAIPAIPACAPSM